MLKNVSMKDTLTQNPESEYSPQQHQHSQAMFRKLKDCKTPTDMRTIAYTSMSNVNPLVMAIQKCKICLAYLYLSLIRPMKKIYSCYDTLIYLSLCSSSGTCHTPLLSGSAFPSNNYDTASVHTPTYIAFQFHHMNTMQSL